MIDRQSDITKELAVLTRQRYTGTLKVKASNLQQWIIYLRLGRLVWIDASYHANRSLQRHLAKYCPQFDVKKIALNSLENIPSCNYQYLTVLFEQKLIEKKQIKAIVNSIILENIFDIIQQEEKKNINYTLQNNPDSPILEAVLKIAFTLVDVEDTLKQASDNWQTWKEKGLESWNQNIAPRIKNKTQLQQEVSEVVYRNFVKFIDGNNTLKDLAFKMNSETFKVACSLVKYIRKGLLELVEVGDLKTVEKIDVRPMATSVKPNNNQIASNQKLIVTIDDSKVICHIMKEIVEKAGYKFIGIQQPLQAIPTLIGVKPDLIFLDLAMPIVNGYEICSQIRRISLFKKIPIAIVTSNDGLIEKAKSKATGATDFLSKPIIEEVILKTLDKHLSSDRKSIKINKREKLRFVTAKTNYATA